MPARLPLRLLGFAALVAALLLPMDPAVAEPKKTILVFTSDTTTRAQEIAESYKEATPFAIRVSHDLGRIPDPVRFMSEDLAEFSPDLVFAVGDVALRASARVWPTVPIVYTDVRATVVRTVGRGDLVDVSARVDPTATVAALGAVLPGLRVLGAVRRRGDEDPYWAALTAACDAAGVRLAASVADGPDASSEAVARALFGADMLLVLDDPRLWTSESLAGAFAAAQRARVPVVTWDAAHFGADPPPALAIAAEARAIALEAAEISSEILEKGREPAQIRAGYPEPLLTGDRRALLEARVPLTRAASAEVDVWVDRRISP